MDGTRRSFVGASAASLAALTLGGCLFDDDAYSHTVAEQAAPLPATPYHRDLVRYATLAANSHNTQPWRFEVHHQTIAIVPDFSRRTPAVDPDDHHLFASLGCAAENLSLAAKARAMAGAVLFDPTSDGTARFDLTPARRDETDLFAAIPVRQCSRATYDDNPVPGDVMERLESAANSYGVDAIMVTDPRRSEDILGLVVDGNSRQIDDPAFTDELKAWIRFNPDTALAARDGLYSASTGNPALPTWLGHLMFDLTFTKGAENDKVAEHIRSSAGIVIFVAQTNNKQGWFNAGRACQRFALQATADGLKHAFINQPIEVPEIRAQLQTLMGLGDRRPNLVVRFGYGPAMPQSLRRPVDDVIFRRL